MPEDKYIIKDSITFVNYLYVMNPILYIFSVSLFFPWFSDVMAQGNSSFQLSVNDKPIKHSIFWTDKNVEINDCLIQSNTISCAGSIWSEKYNQDIWIGTINTEKQKIENVFVSPRKYLDKAHFINYSDNLGYFIGGAVNKDRLDEDSFVAFSKSLNDNSWKKTLKTTYGSNSQELFNAVELSNGNILGVGFTKEKPNGLVVLMNSKGQKLKKKYFGGDSKDFLLDVVKCPNKDFLIVGTKGGYHNISGSSFIKKDADIYLLRIDKDLNIIFEKEFSFGAHEFGQKILPFKNGFLLLSTIQNNFSSGFDPSLLYLDQNGDIFWNCEYGSPDWDYAEDMWISESNIYLLSTSSGNIILSKLDYDGNLLENLLIQSEHNLKANKVLINGSDVYVSGKILEKQKVLQSFIVSFDINSL